MSDQKPAQDILYTEEEAAALLKMTPRMLAKRRRAKKIACIKDGWYIAYTDKQLADYCNKFKIERGDTHRAKERRDTPRTVVFSAKRRGRPLRQRPPVSDEEKPAR